MFCVCVLCVVCCVCVVCVCVCVLCVCVCVTEKDIRHQAVDEMMQRIKKEFNCDVFLREPTEPDQDRYTFHTNTKTLTPWNFIQLISVIKWNYSWFADEIFSKDVLNWSKVKSKDIRFIFQINAVFFFTLLNYHDFTEILSSTTVCNIEININEKCFLCTKSAY